LRAEGTQVQHPSSAPRTPGGQLPDLLA